MLKKVVTAIVLVVYMILDYHFIHLYFRQFAPPLMPDLYINDTIVYIIFHFTIILGFIIVFKYFVWQKNSPYLYRLLFLSGMTMMMVFGYCFDIEQSGYFLLGKNTMNKITVDSKNYEFEYTDDYSALKPLVVDIESDEYLTLNVPAPDFKEKWIFEHHGIEIIDSKKILSTSFKASKSLSGSSLKYIYKIKITDKDSAYLHMKVVDLDNQKSFDEVTSFYDISLNISYIEPQPYQYQVDIYHFGNNIYK